MTMKTVTIKLLGREWKFKCATENYDQFYQASLSLNKDMEELHKKQRATGYEHILILAAMTAHYKCVGVEKENRKNKTSITEIKDKVVRLRDHLAKELVA